MKKKLVVQRVLGIIMALAVMFTMLPTNALSALAADSDENVNLLEIGSWDFWTGEGGAGSKADNEDGSASITVTAAGNQNYAVQYTHMLEMVEGATYQVAMDFYCDSDAVVYLNIQETGSWSSILPAEAQTVNLKGGETYHYTATTTAAGANFVANGKLALMFGNTADNVGKTITVSNAEIIGPTSHKESTGEETTEAAGEETGEAINLETATIELYCGTDWSGSAATVTTDGTKATLDVTNFGWNGEWGLQYMIKNLGLISGEQYTVSFDITSTVDKKIFFKVDNSGMIAEAIQLTGGETYHYNKVITAGTPSNDIMYFALGQMSGEDANRSGVVTIENVKLSGKTDSSDTETTASGKQHDFSTEAAEDNAANDYADPGTPDGYTLIWSDEFDGNYGDDTVDANTGLNLDNWAYQLGDGTTDCSNYGWGNQELECYTKNAKNISVNEDLNGDGEGDGMLRITAAYEKDGIYYANESVKYYSSARIRTTSNTEALFDTTYGYIESRIALPETQGAWPAFWMLPESTDIYGGWPVSGEIDILETTGLHTDSACGTLHWGTPSHVYKGSGYVDLDSDIHYFHTYAINWEPGKIQWIYDGEVIHEATDWASAISGTSDSLSFDAPFDEPFYMLLNLAVDSGNFGGTANKANFTDTANMYVDYVRCYQKSEGYAAQATASAASGSAEDWADYAGVNQIADITADNLNSQGGGLDDSATDKATWYLSNQSDAAGASLAAYTDADGTTWAEVTIAAAGSQDYSNQLIGHYDAKKGYTYKVTFDAYATGDMVGKTVNCDSKEYSGWSTYGITTAKLSATSQSYAFAFNQTENFNNCRIEFNLGAQGTGKVYISNVRVEIIDPSSIADVTGGRQVLSGGEMLYNSTFDQGANHFGYWTASEGTTVSIPRYTTEDLTGSDVSVVDVASETNYEKVEGGVKYYERRAQISAEADTSAQIYQADFSMGADNYTASFELYSETDSAVKVSIYSTKEENGKTVLDEEVLSRVYAYSAADGVKKYSFTFTTTEDIENAAIVFTFAKNTAVQLDDVHLKGATQGIQVKDNPLEDGITWKGDDGNGNSISLINETDGGITMKNFSSGANWYAWQLVSSDFSLAAGYDYKLAFDYKLTGNTNNTFQYIVQEDGGSWTVIKDVETVTYASGDADDNGYNHYEVTLHCSTSLDDCHLVFGFGNSAASPDNTFTLNNLTLTKVTAGEASSEEVSDSDDSDTVDPSVFTNPAEKDPTDTDDTDDTEDPEDTEETEEPSVPATPVTPANPTNNNRPAESPRHTQTQPTPAAPAQPQAQPAPAQNPAQAAPAQNPNQGNSRGRRNNSPARNNNVTVEDENVPLSDGAEEEAAEAETEQDALVEEETAEATEAEEQTDTTEIADEETPEASSEKQSPALPIIGGIAVVVLAVIAGLIAKLRKAK